MKSSLRVGSSWRRATLSHPAYLCSLVVAIPSNCR